MAEYYVGRNVYHRQLPEEKITKAVEEGNLDLVKTFLAEADVRYPLFFGYKLLCKACSSPNGTSDMVKLLLKVGRCDPNDTQGQMDGSDTPLHLAAVKGDYDMVDVLLQFNANINAGSRYDEKPIHTACRHGHEDIILQLLKAGADIDCTDCEQNTPLFYALTAMRSNIVALLVHEGCDVDALNSELMTPLDHSLMYQHIESIKEVIKGGCNYSKDSGHVYYQDHYSNYLLYSLIRMNNLGSLKLLLENGYLFTPEYRSAMANKNMIQLLNNTDSDSECIEFIQSLRNYQKEPLSLLKLCRINVRKRINECRGRTSLTKSIFQLKLPHSIITFLSFGNREEY